MKFSSIFLVIGISIMSVGISVLGGLTGTPHDFTAAGWSGNQICLPCHTPHNANIPIGRLWNHAVPVDTDFTKRSGSSISIESLRCLGCHDGQTALDSFSGVTGVTQITGRENLGRDLTNDHPIGIPYPTGSSWGSLGTYYGRPAVMIGTKGLPLYGVDNRIECSTCHTAHSNTNGNFLRVSNTGSAICLACHISKA